MSGLFCASLAACIPNVTFSRTYLTTSYSKSSQLVYVPSAESILFRSCQTAATKRGRLLNEGGYY